MSIACNYDKWCQLASEMLDNSEMSDIVTANIDLRENKKRTRVNVRLASASLHYAMQRTERKKEKI